MIAGQLPGVLGATMKIPVGQQQCVKYSDRLAPTTTMFKVT